MRLPTRLLPLMLCFMAALAACAQSAVPAKPGVVPITLGNSVVPLYGPWKFQIGDSPVVDGKPMWASPQFDDAAWETVDLTPEAGAAGAADGGDDYVKGWAAKGHPQYKGWGWYRIHVNVAAAADAKLAPNPQLAVEAPDDVDDVYQFFADGMLLGSLGRFSPGKEPLAVTTRPEMFVLPNGRPEVLAFRVFMDPRSSVGREGGGLHAAPQLGSVAAVRLEHRAAWQDYVKPHVFLMLLCVLSLMLTGITGGLFLFDRTDRAYAWLAGVFFLQAARESFYLASEFANITSNYWTIVVFVIYVALMSGAWVMVWWSWFRLSQPAWMPRLVGVLTGLLVVVYLLPTKLIPGLRAHNTYRFAEPASIVINACFIGILVFIVYQGFRKHRTEVWLALPALALMSMAEFHYEVKWNFHMFGVPISNYEFSNLALIVLVFALLMRRLFQSIHRQKETELELLQAQEVQRVLLPATDPVVVPGLEFESDYRPAREVGGDFFQIVPHASDGSVLVVVGDVAGKGLQAGMLVAVLVGAMRSTFEWNSDPAFMLEALNRRLDGRGNACATCLAMRIAADGKVTLANAGHLAPYLNGVELQMEGALPVGMFAEAEFPVMCFELRPGDTLTMVSDGVLEATNEKGELFGFERVRELVKRSHSASEIAAAAQAFGQEDDISVVTVRRVDSHVTQGSLDAGRLEVPNSMSMPKDKSVEVRIPSALGFEKVAMESAGSMARLMGFSEDRVEDLKTAVAEACINAIEHGNRGDASIPVAVVLSMDAGKLEVKVLDDGDGMSKPPPKPDIDRKMSEEEHARGMGMFLIQALVDEVEWVPNTEGQSFVRLVIRLDKEGE